MRPNLAGSEPISLWVAVGRQKNKQILALSISNKRKMYVAGGLSQVWSRFIGRHFVSTNGDKFY